MPWRCFLVFAFVASCGGREASERAPDAAPSAAPVASPAPIGNSMGMLGSLLSTQLEQPGPYEELAQSETLDPSKPRTVVLELDDQLSELEKASLFDTGRGLVLRRAFEKIRELRGDDETAKVILRISGIRGSLAVAEELRSALRLLAQAKPLHCHLESGDSLAYFMATACSEISLAPAGMLFVGGPSATPVHLKGLLDRLGVRADFISIGQYKNAAEPLTRFSPSPESIVVLDEILDARMGTWIRAVAPRVGGEEKAKGVVDQALFSTAQAKEYGLVDRVEVFEVFRERVSGGQWAAATWREKKSFDMGELMRFMGGGAKRIGAPHIALVYAVGTIIDGKGEGVIGARAEIASRTLIATIEALARDDHVKAVVLRVDSPGGSALASEQILHALSRLKAKKPVVVSMGSLAASGGYYISAHASRIFAHENTLTGSIGVVGGKLTLGGALDKLGISTFPRARGKRSQLWSPLRVWTAGERTAVREWMRSAYDLFVSHVAAGRKLEVGKVEAIAEGRVWVGTRAVEIGLVDEIGGLEAALEHAHSLGGVAPESPLEVYPPRPTLRDILGRFGGTSGVLTAMLAHLPRELSEKAQGLLVRAQSFSDEPVQATSLWLSAL